MTIPAHFETSPASANRPRAARRRLLLETEGETTTGRKAQVTIHNVSATGLLIETTVPLADGERIDIILPEAGSTTASVVWASGGFYGCRFATSLKPGVLSALQLRGDPPVPDATPAMTPAPTPAQTPSPAPLAQLETLPIRIARLRKEQGLTLDALAELVGVSKPTVWAWEQGRARPTQERLATLAAKLGVVEEDLLTGRDGEALGQAIARAREQVANAYGVETARVRIMIEL